MFPGLAITLIRSGALAPEGEVESLRDSNARID